ncbi:unnamed protein product [Heterobilharzia americana]|nr:unnamed protein product [Heterobilharzia americana]
MSRHRNIRSFCDDDVDTYDEPLASSVDDDYTISPNTSERYIYNPDRGFKHDIPTFPVTQVEPLSFTSADFPLNEVMSSQPESPGEVSGRIVSRPLFDFPNQKDATNINCKDNQQTSAEIFGNSDLFDAGVIKPMNATAENKLVSNIVPVNRSKLEELDFDLLDQLTSQPSGTLQLSLQNPTKCKPNLHINKTSSNFQSNHLHLLSKTTNLFISNCSISKFTGNATYDIGVGTANTETLGGCKTPSFLGLLMPSYSTSSSEGFNGMLLKFSYILVRTRSPFYNCLFLPHPVSGFGFDIPEPKTFERHFTKPTGLKTMAKQFGLPKTSHGSCNPQARPTALDKPMDTSLINLPLSQKLTITSHTDDRPNLLRTPINSVTATPTKPIDRHFLVNEYAKLHEKFGDKQIINLIVMGHVDAGKSTLMGNLLYLLGHVSSKQLAKYQWDAQKLGKASFAYAWILDQTAEERNRGVTMDIAQTSFETKSKRIALMDAPGHKDFVPQVIGGATQADAALLVINATRGEFETGIGTGGQTREHARLARLLGVSRLIVAINKMDTVDWCESRYHEIQSQISGFLKSMNFSGVVYCPVSGLTGVNLIQQDISNGKNASESNSKLFTWYTGPCLLELIDSIPPPERTIDGPFRFVVSDIFKPAGSSVPAVVGRVVSGGVSAGVNLPTSKVICLPSDVRACVKSIRSLCNTRSGQNDTATEGDLGGKLLDQVVKFAFAGDQVALMLTDIDPFQTLIPGDLLTDPDNPIPSATCISAKLLVFAIRQPITKGYPVIYYYNCTSVAANITRLRFITHRENKIEKTVKKPRLVVCLNSFFLFVVLFNLQ